MTAIRDETRPSETLIPSLIKIVLQFSNNCILWKKKRKTTANKLRKNTKRDACSRCGHKSKSRHNQPFFFLFFGLIWFCFYYISCLWSHFVSLCQLFFCFALRIFLVKSLWKKKKCPSQSIRFDLAWTGPIKKGRKENDLSFAWKTIVIRIEKFKKQNCVSR